MTNDTKALPLFSELGIAPKLLDILAQNKYIHPTPIQHQCIPLALEGKDVVGIAQTGTGKTLAFGLPMLQQLAKQKGQGLILLPTRELALQVEEVLQKIGRPLGLKTACLIGGASIKMQLQSLRRGPHIIVATPGRLIDHLHQNYIHLDKVSIVVLDEADRMLDIGFMPQIKEILKQTPTERQTFMFSATMPSAIAEIASKHMKAPLRIEVAPAGTPAANVEQEVFFVERHTKLSLLKKILAENPGTVLVFSRTKHGAKKITFDLRKDNISAAEIHSNKSLAQRRMALDGFKSGRFRVLVATDIAARGIDVNNISLVLNYDLPDNPDDYVHRIGRTGRAGKSGKAISFATYDQRYDVKTIERLIKKSLPVMTTPVLPRQELTREELIDAADAGKAYGRTKHFAPRPQTKSSTWQERKPYAGNATKSFSKPFTRTYGDKDAKPFAKPYGARTTKAYGSRDSKPFGDRDAKPFERKSGNPWDLAKKNKFPKRKGACLSGRQGFTAGPKKREPKEYFYKT